MRGTRQIILRLLKDEDGLESFEYAIIAAIVAAVALLIYGSGWGQTLRDIFLDASKGHTSVTL
jgi:Flp pilus assembly pilin Flp